MKLLAISDLHLQYQKNQDLLRAITEHADDWLILAGDVGEGIKELAFAFECLKPKFAKLIWVPGNHELWTMPGEALRGEQKYQHLVNFCRNQGVITPEDEYLKVSFDEKPYFLVPTFTLYDYSFRPDTVAFKDVINWAAEGDIVSADERVLHPNPYESREAWCKELVEKAEQRLGLLDRNIPIILINHFPLRQDLVRLHRVPRYSPWCGTRLTQDWHKKFNIKVVVNGHTHTRATDWRDGVRFEEVSVGYPRQRRDGLESDSFLRLILPESESPPPMTGVHTWTY